MFMNRDWHIIKLTLSKSQPTFKSFHTKNIVNCVKNIINCVLKSDVVSSNFREVSYDSFLSRNIVLSFSFLSVHLHQDTGCRSRYWQPQIAALFHCNWWRKNLLWCCLIKDCQIIDTQFMNWPLNQILFSFSSTNFHWSLATISEICSCFVHWILWNEN